MILDCAGILTLQQGNGSANPLNPPRGAGNRDLQLGQTAAQRALKFYVVAHLLQRFQQSLLVRRRVATDQPERIGRAGAGHSGAQLAAALLGAGGRVSGQIKSLADKEEAPAA